MKKGMTYVAFEKFVAVAKELGLETSDKEGFVKVTGTVPNRALYVAKTKGVARIDVSGFTHSLTVEIPEAKRPTKRVVAGIDFRGTDEASILRSFYRVAKDGLVEGLGETLPTGRVGRTKAAPSPEEIENAVLVAMSE